MNYEDFKLVIHDRKSFDYVDGKNTLPGKINLDTVTERVIKLFRSWVSQDRLKRREEFSLLGTLLFNALFSDYQIRKTFEEQKGRIEKRTDTRMRLILEFESDSQDLATWPWEFLYYPDSPSTGKGCFLATEDQLILARHVPLVLPGLKPYNSPLNMLVVISKPEKTPDGVNMDRIVYEEVLKELEELTNSSQNESGAKLIQLYKIENPTKAALLLAIKEYSPQLVHIFAHGEYRNVDNTRSGYLALVKEKDSKIANWIKDEDLADCFKNREPRLIFLHACQGAQSDSYETFRGLALTLAYSRIPAVVAMQYSINNSVASRFAKVFYRALGEGKAIDEAVQEGRMAIGTLDDEDNYSGRDFGCPVVYLQSGEGIVITSQERKSLEDVGHVPLPELKPEIVQCPYSLARSVLCLGWVPKPLPPDFAICPECRHPVLQCPRGHVFRGDLGVCYCGYSRSQPETEQRISAPPIAPQNSPARMPAAARPASASAAPGSPN